MPRTITRTIMPDLTPIIIAVVMDKRGRPLCRVTSTGERS
jgi:hypothetical protein